MPLSADTCASSVLRECLREASWSDSTAHPNSSNHIVNALYLKYKARCSYVVADNTLASALDVVRVADIMVLVVDGSSGQEFVIDKVSHVLPSFHSSFLFVSQYLLLEWRKHTIGAKGNWPRLPPLLRTKPSPKEAQDLHPD